MELDPSSWYRITLAGGSERSLAGTYPYLRGDVGLVTITTTDASTPSQQWQLFPLGTFGYILRTQASGVHGYLAINDRDGTCEGSEPLIVNQLTMDRALLWTIASRDDGTFQLGNSVNGRDCTLAYSHKDDVFLSSATNGVRPSQWLASTKLGKINDQAFLALTIPLATRVAVNAMHTTPTILATSSGMQTVIPTPTSPLISNWHTKATPSTALSSPSPSLALPTKLHSARLSLPAAMGIGVAVGIVSLVILLSIFLLLYRQYHVRYSRSSRHYRRAKLWKGFTPATPSTARTTFTETKMANIYFAELPTPATPAFMLSPPLGNDFENRTGWVADHRASIRSFGTILPGSPRNGPIELPT